MSRRLVRPTLVPPTVVVAVISTTPAPAGAVAVIDVSLLTVKLAAVVAPNWTAVAPVKLVLVIVTVVPPAAGPEVGEMDVMVGMPAMVSTTLLLPG